ncbi:putative SET domain-containing protein [Tupanvirus deep ocean]|uniref:SET domain-containing protein n=2 Tax=Tupanvirus TaxID=2094720 RepID=A0AC62A8J8_9VIRU|nr:putative SET domain-containing protein [Tupanvirus deep ocean]QKU33987.1 putative SET domain-containing protein [Tupanvirus deep ocean]
MENKYTACVYLSDYIGIFDTNNNKFVIANKEIPANTLLLIEHVYTGTSTDCHLLVRDNEFFYDSLCPRMTSWKDEKEEEKDQVSLVKVVRNCIGKNLNNMFIGDYMSKFNHTCFPNSAFFLAVSKNHHGLVTNYIALFSTKNIASGEEITINYGVDRGHNTSDDFICDCGKSKEDRDKVCNIIYELINNLRKTNMDSIVELVSEYEKNDQCRKILIHQYLAKKGLISTNDNVVSMTQSFVQHLNSVYGDGTTSGTLDDKKDKMIDHINELFSYLD